MGFKPKGKDLTRTGRATYIAFEKLINKRRSEDPTTKQSHRNSARIYAEFLTRSHQPLQASHNTWKQKHANAWLAERAGQVTRGQLEKDCAMLRYIADAQGRKDLMPSKNPDFVKRGKVGREQPKTHDLHDRAARQSELERIDLPYGLAARVTNGFGERLAESLTSRWVVVKEIGADDKTEYWSNWGTKNPAEDIHQITIRQLRYMYATLDERAARNTPKDYAFERRGGQLDLLTPGQAYLYIGRESKNGVKHFSPITTDAQWDTVKAVNKYCAENKTENLYDGRTQQQAEKHFSYLLARVGMTKAEAGYTIHVDRHMYITTNPSGLNDEELIRAVGHSDVRKLDAYRPKI